MPPSKLPRSLSIFLVQASGTKKAVAAAAAAEAAAAAASDATAAELREWQV